LGLAVGVFAGCFLFFGLQTIIGIILAAVFRASKVAAAAGTWISNPLTYVPIFVFNYKVGKFLLGIEKQSIDSFDLQSFSSFMELGFSFAATLLLGCLLVGFFVATLTYFLSLRFLRRLRKHKRKLRVFRSK
jgi:hypothetical protein